MKIASKYKLQSINYRLLHALVLSLLDIYFIGSTPYHNLSIWRATRNLPLKNVLRTFETVLNHNSFSWGRVLL